MKAAYFLVLLISLSAQAQTFKNEDVESNEQIQEKVKRRIYPGGVDEGDLKVQVQLAIPTRKMAPTAEEPAEPNSED